jgi:phenylalanyl-tRNA synthetase beta chain
MAAMRSSLWPGLVKALQHNLNRQQDRVRLFESGLRFVGQLEDLKQEPMLAGVVCGSRLPEGWAQGRDTVDFFDVKADVEAVLGFAGALDAFTFVRASIRRCTRVKLRASSVMGVWSVLSARFTLSCRKPWAWIVRYSFSNWFWLKSLRAKCRNSSELSRFPEVRRDLALIADKDVAASAVLDVIRENAGEWLTDLRLFDVYQGKGIDPDRKSLAVGLTWQHPSRTLNDDEVNSTTQNILTSLEQRLNATLRK